MGTSREQATTNNGRLPFKQFRLANIVDNCALVMVAKRGSGKSWVTRAVMQQFHDIPCGIVISKTDGVDPFYRNFFPDTYIYYKYESRTIQKLFKRQEDINEKSKRRVGEGKKPLDTRTFIIMDDCLGEKKAWAKDEPIQELLFNGRHYDVMYILTMQFPLGISPELRGNFDYIFLLADDTISNLKRMHEHYAGMFPSLDAFRQIFDELTKDFGAMVVVNKGIRRDIRDKIFWYNAPDLDGDETKYGCRQFRQFHDDNYDKEWKKNQRGDNIVDICIERKRAKIPIKVEKQEVDNNNQVIDKKKVNKKR